MALSFPDHHVRLDIVEGLRAPEISVDTDGWATLKLSSEHMADFDLFRQIMHRLHDLLHDERPSEDDGDAPAVTVIEALEPAEEPTASTSAA